jgi:hypothetical protein
MLRFALNDNCEINFELIGSFRSGEIEFKPTSFGIEIKRENYIQILFFLYENSCFFLH